MALEDSGVRFKAEGEQEFARALEGAAHAVDGFGRAAENVTSRIGTFGEMGIGALRRLGEVAVDALGKTINAVTDYLSDSFNGAVEAQAGIDALNATINNLGDAAPITSERALELADQFKNLAGGSDDAVIAAEAILLRFNKISGETFPRVLESAGDLAAVLKTSMPAAAQILGKVLQDFSIDGAGSLSRLKAAGVALTDQQENQIQTMIRLGDVAGAQNYLLDVLQETIGGRGAAAAATAAGQWAIFTESIADAGEGIMLELMPTLTRLANRFLPQISEAFGGAAEKVGVVTGAIADFVDKVFSGEEPIRSLAETVMTVADAFGLDGGGMYYAITQLKTPFDDLISFVETNWPKLQSTISESIDTLEGPVTRLWDVLSNKLGKALGEIWTALTGEAPDAQTIFEDTMQAVEDAANGLADFIDNTFLPALEDVERWWNENWPIVQTKAEEVMGAVQTAWEDGLNAVQDFWDEWSPIFTEGWEEWMSDLDMSFDTFAFAFEGDWRSFGAQLRANTVETWEGIRATIANILTWFKNADWGKIGRDVMISIVAGVISEIQRLIDVVVAATKAAWEAGIGFLTGQPTPQFNGGGQPGSSDTSGGGKSDDGGSSGGGSGGTGGGGSKSTGGGTGGSSKSTGGGKKEELPGKSSSQVDKVASAGLAGALSSSASVVNNYNLTVNASQSAGNLVRDFGTMSTLWG